MPICLIPLLVVAIGAGPEGVAMKDVVRGNNQFGFDLYGKLRARPANLFVSPYSIATALAMTHEGARGSTAKEMTTTLHLPVDDKLTRQGFAALHAQIVGGKEARPYELSTANALWGQLGLNYRNEFLERAQASFGAGFRPVDFASDPEAARSMINGWVEQQTRDKITNILAPSNVKPGTDLILTNAIYFKGSWATPFPKSATKDEAFGNGNKSNLVPTMHLTDQFGYHEGDGFQAVNFPYVGNDLSMVVLLPRKVDGLPAIESSLTANQVDGWLEKLTQRRVEVSLPRFKLECGAELAGPLAEMGMTSAFGAKADFSGIATDRQLYLSAVIHKAFVDVNEIGTEAAAATAVVMMRSMAITQPQQPVVFKADHPFLFLIRDNRSGSILFLGRVVNPNG